MIALEDIDEIFNERALAILQSTGPDEVCVVRSCDAYPRGRLVKMKRAARDAAFMEGVKKAVDLLCKDLQPKSKDDIANHEVDYLLCDNWVTLTMWLKDGRSASRTVTIEDVVLQ